MTISKQIKKSREELDDKWKNRVFGSIKDVNYGEIYNFHQEQQIELLQAVMLEIEKRFESASGQGRGGGNGRRIIIQLKGNLQKKLENVIKEI